MELILELLFNVFDDTMTGTVLVIYFAFLLLIYKYLKKEKQLHLYLKSFRWKACLTLAVLGHMALILLWDGENAEWKKLWAWLLALNSCYDILVYFYLKYIPSVPRRRMERNINKRRHDLLGLYKYLETVDTSMFSPTDKLYWNRQYYMVLYHMGSVNKAVEIMQETEEKESPRARMLMALRAESRCDIDKSQKLMLQAMDALRSGDTDLLRVQILNNCGRCFRLSGNNETAMQYYDQAADLVGEKTAKEVVHIVYANLIMESCIMGKTPEELDILFAQYKNLIRENQIDDIIEFENVRLSIARQIGAVEQAKKLIEESFERYWPIIEREGERSRKLNYLISSMRIAHMAKLELNRYFDAIRNNLGSLQNLDMPQRYYLTKEIYLALLEPPLLNDFFRSTYRDVLEYAGDYIREAAAADLEQYLSELPSVAVYAVGHTQQELVWLMKHKLQPYNAVEAFERLNSTVELYESQNLKLEALIGAGTLLDELLASQNLKEDLSVKYPERIQDTLTYMEMAVGRLKYHPGCSEQFLKMAYAYIRLHKYEKCCLYYRTFEKCKIAEHHFSVWLKENIAFVKLVTRLVEIKNELKNLKKRAGKERLSPKAVAWLQQYPRVPSAEIVYLLAGLLEMPQACAKVVSWAEVSEAGLLVPKSHWWLCYGEQYPISDVNSLVEIDFCYNEVSEESDATQMVFFPTCHPMQRRSTEWVQKHVVNRPDYICRLDTLVRDLRVADNEYAHLKEILLFVHRMR